MLFTSAILATFAFIGGAVGQGLSLEVHATKSQLLVGEPLLLAGRATSPTRAVFHAGSLRTLVDRGEGLVEIGPRLAFAINEEPYDVTASSPVDFEGWSS